MKTFLLEDIEDDIFVFYGLNFKPFPEYTLIYKINHRLGVSFKRTKDLDIHYSDNIFYHSVYSLDDTSDENTSFIIKNKSIENKEKIENSLFSEIYTSKYLLPRYDKYDYILKLNINLALPTDITLSLQEIDFTISMNEIDLEESEKKLLYL